MSATPREFDHDGAVITDAAGGAFPWIRTASGMWFRQGLDHPRTWDELLAWHQDAVADPADETTAMPTFVLLVPQHLPAAEDEAVESYAAELITMSVLGPDKDCDGDHEDGCCDLNADRLPDGHMRLTFLVTDGTRPRFGQYRFTREVTR